MAETLFAEKGEVWITESGTRIEWCKDVRIGDPITCDDHLIDGEHPEPNVKMSSELSHILKWGNGRKEVAVVILPND